MATETSWGDEIVQLVQIDQPFCDLTYGTSPCQAALGTTGTKKCFNTRRTCQDTDNYTPSDKTLTFSHPQEGVQQYGYVIPLLDSVKTSPVQLNLGSMDRDSKPFGKREKVTIKFMDAQHSDLDVDKYREERINAHGQSGVDGYDPYERGTFWGKWLARNPYHEKYAVRIYEGVMGESLANLRVRHYIIDHINGPADGVLEITCKDLFSLIEARKAQAPLPSRGRLSAAITDSATTFTLQFPTGVDADDDGYPTTSGYVAINSEIMAVTGRTGNDLTVTRAALNTTAEAHEEDDKVQIVLVYDSQRVDAIISDLLQTYSGVTSSNIPSSDWSVEAAANLPNLFTAYIPAPTPVEDLIGELAQQTGFTLWPDVESNEIQLKGIGSDVTPQVTVNDDAWVIEGSLDITRKPDQRVSRAVVFYGQINPLEDLEDEANYQNSVESRDASAEADAQYGTKSIRKIFSRWMLNTQRAAATSIADLILKLFRDPPFRASFAIDVQRAGQLLLADPFAMKTSDMQDDTGAEKTNTMLPMEISRGETEIEILAQKLNLFEAAAQERIINVDNDVNNFNMREQHDAIYSEAADGDEVTVVVNTGAIIGADNNTDYAFRTGSWPDGVTLKLEIKSGAYICGRAGYGGDGAALLNANGADGEDGGPAVLAEELITIHNEGVIGGGGGAGGGGGGDSGFPAEGGGGGGGAGTRPLVSLDQPEGGLGGEGPSTASDGAEGALETGGAGGAAAAAGGAGGAGGDLAQAGTAGGNSSGDGGAGGQPGNAIEGNSLITFLSGGGDIRGAIIT